MIIIIINSDCLLYLTEVLKKGSVDIRKIDFSCNPITNEGYDYNGVKEFVKYIKNSKQILEVKLDGIIGLPEDIAEAITITTMVNRSLYAVDNSNNYDGSSSRFIPFIEKLIISKEKQLMRNTLEDEDIDDYNKVDSEFIKRNGNRVCSVEVVNNNKIILNRNVSVAQKKPVGY